MLGDRVAPGFEVVLRGLEIIADLLEFRLQAAVEILAQGSILRLVREVVQLVRILLVIKQEPGPFQAPNNSPASLAISVVLNCPETATSPTLAP